MKLLDTVRDVFGITWLSPVMLLLFVCANRGLNITEMVAPRVADPRNGSMQLQCHFDMGVEQLYAVKWYKDDNEFFRYTPGQSPYVLKFPVSGVKVVSKKSACTRGRCDLVLTDLDNRDTSGEYRCEVSSEAPAFRIASRTMNVTVAVLPRENPEIENLAETYRLGDHMTAKCASDVGDPTPHLFFYINDRQVSERYVKEVRKVSNHGVSNKRTRFKPERREIQLRVQLDRRHLNSSSLSGKVQVVCASTVPELPSEVYPVLTTTRTVTLLDHNLINNEKYHWPRSTSSFTYVEWPVCFVSCVLTMTPKCFAF